MDLKAMMMEYLQNEGFRPEATEYGLDFKCEGKNFVFFNDEDVISCFVPSTSSIPK